MLRISPRERPDMAYTFICRVTTLGPCAILRIFREMLHCLTFERVQALTIDEITNEKGRLHSKVNSFAIEVLLKNQALFAVPRR